MLAPPTAANFTQALQLFGQVFVDGFDLGFGSFPVDLVPAFGIACRHKYLGPALGGRQVPAGLHLVSSGLELLRLQQTLACAAPAQSCCLPAWV